MFNKKFIATLISCTVLISCSSKNPIRENAINAITLNEHIHESQKYKTQADEVTSLKKDIEELKAQVVLLTKKSQVQQKKVMKNAEFFAKLNKQAPNQITYKHKQQGNKKFPNNPIKNNIAIQLGSFKTQTAVKNSWRNLQQKHATELKNKKLIIESIENKSIYRLKVIPFINLKMAKQTCDYLKTHKQACLLTQY